MSDTSDATWRVFCAIEIPPEIRQRISQHAQRLCESLTGVQASWTKPDNIHLTLKFFGNITQSEVVKASEAAARTVEGCSPFNIEIVGAGSFPPRGPAKVLWIGIENSTNSLSHLQQKLEIECERAGFPKEDRAFHPHLTVARLRSPRGARTLADKHKALGFKAAELEVSSLILLRSELSSKGSKYTSISTHGLK